MASTSSTPELTARLTEEAIPTHRNRADSDSDNSGPVVAHIGESPPGPNRANTRSSLVSQSTSQKHRDGSEKGGSRKAKSGSKQSVCRQQSPPARGNRRNGSIDLTDPDKLLQQLANIDLTDEDTDILLEEAYALNKKLRAELHRQEEAAKKSRGHRLPPLDGQSQAKLHEPTRLYGAGLPGTSPSSRPVQSRPKATMSAGSSSHSHGVMNERRRQQRSPSGKNKLAQSSPPVRNCNRPEWDDRFSYS